jgi:hypothetical protein
MQPFLDPLAGGFRVGLALSAADSSCWFCSFHFCIVSAIESGPVRDLRCFFLVPLKNKKHGSATE